MKTPARAKPAAPVAAEEAAVAPAAVVGAEDGVTLVRAGEHEVQVVDDMPVGTQVHLCMRPEDVVSELMRIRRQSAL